MLNRDFNVTQQGESKVLELYLYGDIESDYYDFWFGKTESKTSCNYIQKAIERAGAVSEIKVFINSCGGSVKEGIAIYNILKRQSIPVTVYIDAFAFSVASVIAMAGDKVVMPSNTTMFLHHAAWGVYGNSIELRKAADDLDVIDEASNKSYLVKAGDKLSAEKLSELLDNETFLGAEQALELGLCDEIVDPVDMSDSKEVVEQAAKSPDKKNAYERKAVAKAVEIIRSEPLKESTSDSKSSSDWFAELFKNTKF